MICNVDVQDNINIDDAAKFFVGTVNNRYFILTFCHELLGIRMQLNLVLNPTKLSMEKQRQRRRYTEKLELSGNGGADA